MIRLLFLLLLLFVASTIAKDVPGFWSIDCGGTGGEGEHNLTWLADRSFVRTGVSREGNNGSLRAFPSKKSKKNCYTIPVGKGVKILVRLTFTYGNYDGLSSPPEMDLIFDGYNWGSLETSMEGGDWMEVIYVTKRNNTSICFGRIRSDQDPSVSSVEVRTLDLNMYSGVDDRKVLSLWRRYAFGANDTISYPDDRYDRYWQPWSEGFTLIRSDTTYADTTDWLLVNDPPASLILTAVGPPNGSSTLILTEPDFYQEPTKVYYNMYFSEMSNKTTPGERSFSIFIDGSQDNTDPITPLYQDVYEFYNADLEMTNRTVFSLVPNQNSTLPPIISGIEIFQVEDGSDGTFENDVVALGILQEHFKILQEWTGDPCLPENYNWEWVGCQLFNAPRVSKLDLSGFGLSGKLPDFTDLDQLVVIDLHNNSLNGPIPEFFNNFQNLNMLNLADNKFTSIPDSLLHNKKIKLNISGNPISQPAALKNEERKAHVPDQLLLSVVILLLIILF